MTTTDPTLRELVEHILAATQPERIILFGSRARGQEGPRSDFDVLVIQDSGEPRYKRAGLIYRALAAFPAEVDVVVYTPSEVEEWRGVPEAFVTTAVREGKTLYAREG